jgi:hypothetical protein
MGRVRARKTSCSKTFVEKEADPSCASCGSFLIGSRQIDFFQLQLQTFSNLIQRANHLTVKQTVPISYFFESLRLFRKRR